MNQISRNSVCLLDFQDLRLDAFERHNHAVSQQVSSRD